jgi:hypothetical protein
MVSSAEEFRDRLARAACDGVAPCCTRFTPPFAKDACLQGAGELLNIYYGPRLFFGGVGKAQLNPTQASACLAQVRASAATCFEKGQGGPFGHSSQRTDPCAYVFTGAGQPGEPCSGEDSLTCAPSGGDLARCQQGKCVVVRLAKAGESCGTSSPASECDEGLVCDDVSLVCRTPRTEGAACNSRDGCDQALGLACDKGSGRCGRAPALGEPCSYGCQAGAYCPSGSKPLCVPLGTDGAPCERSDQCAPTHHCLGTCVRRVAAGQPCSTSDACAAGTFCAKGQCRPIAALGAACEGDDDEVCVPGARCDPRDLGQSLMSPSAPRICLPEHYPLLCYARKR